MPRAEWPAGLEEELKPLWDAEHGDRQQVSGMERKWGRLHSIIAFSSFKEFVVIGTEMDSDKVEAALKRCLLTDQEMGMGQETWEAMDDPFKEDWEGEGEEDGHGHGPHGHGHVHGHHH